MAFSEETIQQVWEKATPVAGNDPAVWRQDQCKAWIGRRFYGNRNSEYGLSSTYKCNFLGADNKQ